MEIIENSKSEIMLVPIVEITKSISILMHLLVTNKFVNLRSVLIVYNSNHLTNMMEDYLESIQDAFRYNSMNQNATALHWINIANLNQYEFNLTVLETIDLGAEGFITILPITLDFLHARYYATETSVLRLKDKHFLFLTENENPKDILSQEILKFYPSHILIKPSEKCLENFEAWTQNFVTDNKNLVPIHLDTFYANQTFDGNAELYTNKLANLHGRIIKVASVTYSPYIISNFVAPGTGNVDSIYSSLPKKSILYMGSEGNTLLSYCKIRNCTIQVQPFGKDKWGGIYENGSSDGMIGAVYRKEVEFGMGCYYNWYNEIFETSTVIAKSAVRILGPAPSRYPPFMTNILPFSGFLWTLIISSILLSSFVMHAVKIMSYKIKNRNLNSYVLTLLQIIAIFLQQSFPQKKLDRFASRFFLATLLFVGITLENTYSGQLKSLLTVPLFTEPVDTIEKFAASNWKWGAPALAWILTINDSDIFDEKVMTQKFEIRSYQELLNLTFSGTYGFGVEKLHGGIYTFGDYIKNGNLNGMILLKDDLFYDWTRGFAIRGWPFMDDFNTIVLWTLEHGLFVHWENQLVTKELNQNTAANLMSLQRGHFDKPPPSALAIAHVSGPLMILAIGYLIGCFILICEIAFNKYKKLFFSKSYVGI